MTYTISGMHGVVGYDGECLTLVDTHNIGYEGSYLGTLNVRGMITVWVVRMKT